MLRTINAVPVTETVNRHGEQKLSGLYSHREANRSYIDKLDDFFFCDVVDETTLWPTKLFVQVST